ncbi:MAG: DUF1156 domain-containing protein [Acidobacteriota bacterium]|nr:DUF1156 domain-containing protein [Acidobacteriota bacterium]
MIDQWFPVAAVDQACRTPEGSGRNEKAIFTWFASRPIAQARAAVLTAVLPDLPSLRRKVTATVLSGIDDDLAELGSPAGPSGQPVTLLDCFSGRGIIPLEAAKLGLRAEGIDVSPVATLAGRLLADWPLRDWSGEPPLPFSAPYQQPTTTDEDDAEGADEPFLARDFGLAEPRIIRDLRLVFTEIARKVELRLSAWFPKNPAGSYPWGYLWAITIPCDSCRRRFPLVGETVLRHPYLSTNDPGQAFRIVADQKSGKWRVDVHEGQAIGQPTFSSAPGRKGRSARCAFCAHVHPLEAVKAKGFAGEYEDAVLLGADLAIVEVVSSKGRVRGVARKVFRALTEAELRAATTVDLARVLPLEPVKNGSGGGVLRAIPDERIPLGANDTVRASGYGYGTFGSLMNDRQTLLFVETARAIHACFDELCEAGLSKEYARALTGYAASNMCRRLRCSTRGSRLRAHGSPSGSAQNRNQVDHVFANESQVYFGFDWFETGLGAGPGTWLSLSETTLTPLLAHVRRLTPNAVPARFRRASATALPLRDASVDVVVTDPPYYRMIQYGDASNLMYVWLRRCLFDVIPDLFGEPGDSTGLQDVSEEIIVSRRSGANDHRDEFWYERQLSKAFHEMRRVLKPGGHLVVVFGHSDPDAWRRLLGALQTAGFVVTSAWPSRTESGDSDVASIRVTVSIGCRLALPKRPTGMAAEVDREVVEAVEQRVSQWDADGLALEDQLMASYGPAMEVYGRYSRVINPDGSDADLDRYLTIARRAVRDAMRLRVDELPLETFDAITRLAVFWLRAKGRAEVPKGEARFFAQADELRLAELRDRILAESQVGFRLRLDDPGPVTPASSVFEVVRSMAHAWEEGGTEAVAEVISRSGRDASDQHLWAVVGDLAGHLPASDKTAKALAGVKRTSSTISTLAGSVQDSHSQAELFSATEE